MVLPRRPAQRLWFLGMLSKTTTEDLPGQTRVGSSVILPRGHHVGCDHGKLLTTLWIYCCLFTTTPALTTRLGPEP